MAAPPARTPAPRRGAARSSGPSTAASTAARSSSLSLPLLILAFSDHPAAAAPGAAAAAELRRRRDAAARGRPRRPLPRPPPGAVGSLARGAVVPRPDAPYGLPVPSDTWEASVPGLGRVRLQNLWAVAPGQSRDAIVVHGAPRRHRRRPGRERRRVGHRRARRARAQLRALARRPRDSVRSGAHDRLPLDRRRRVRRPRRAALRRAAAVPGRRGDQPRRDRRARRPAGRDRGRHAALAAATLVETAAQRVLEQSGRPRAVRASSPSCSTSASRSRSTSRARSSRAASRR